MSPSGSGAAGIAVAAAVAFLSCLLAGGSLALALAGRRAERDDGLRRHLAALAALLPAAALALLPLSLAEAWLSAPGGGALASWRRAFGHPWLLLGAVAAGAASQARWLRRGQGRPAPLVDWATAAAALAFLVAAATARAALDLPGRAPGTWAPVDGSLAALLLPRALAALVLGGALLLPATGGEAASSARRALASPRLAAAVLGLAFLAAAGAEAARAPLLAPPPGPLSPGAAADGQALFAARCRGCHTVAGPRGVRRHLDGRSLDQIGTVLHTLEKRHGHAPYPGPDGERPVLARWLAALDGIVEPEGVEAGDFLARGRRVMEGFCLSCHVLDGPPSRNPLRPKVQGWTQEEAYRTVGRLSRLNPGMIDYDGPDPDRQALAAWLAIVGAEGQP